MMIMNMRKQRAVFINEKIKDQEEKGEEVERKEGRTEEEEEEERRRKRRG